MDERAIDENPICGPVLGQRQRLVAMRGLSLHSLEDALGFGTSANADHVGTRHVQERFQVERTVNLEKAKLENTKWYRDFIANFEFIDLEFFYNLDFIDSLLTTSYTTKSIFFCSIL